MSESRVVCGWRPRSQCDKYSEAFCCSDGAAWFSGSSSTVVSAGRVGIPVAFSSSRAAMKVGVVEWNLRRIFTTTPDLEEAG